MRRIFAFVSVLLLMCLSQSALAADRTIVVLDGSGSMWGQINGKTKIEIARETLDTVLHALPGDAELGLMVYGHREKGLCSDIELAVPPRAGSAADIMSFANKINPKGKTPLSEAVKQAAEALVYTEDKATIVLVTDGLETCEADPCALASALEQKGVDFTVHVVGFGLTDDEGKQVACLAENTGGRYLQAADASELASALETTVLAPVKPELPEQPAKPEFNVMTDAVLVEGGPSLGDDTRVYWQFFKTDGTGGRAGEAMASDYGAARGFNLEPGQYIGVAQLGRIEIEVPFEVAATATAKPIANFNAATLILTPKRTPDGAADETARVYAKFGGLEDGGYGETQLMVLAGEVKIGASIGRTEVEETISIKAGETLAKDIVVGTGVIVTKAVYADGGPPVEGGAMYFQVVQAQTDINGNRAEIDGTYGIDSTLNVPVGNLVLTGKLGSATGETPVTVEAGQRQEVTVNINAGVIAVTAPGAYRVDIRQAKKDIQGNQKDVSGGYDENYQDTVPAGDYIVHVTYSGDRAPADKPATVKAGERTEVIVE